MPISFFTTLHICTSDITQHFFYETLNFTVRLTQFRITMGTHFWVFVSTFLERGGAMGGSQTKQGKKTLHLQQTFSLLLQQTLTMALAPTCFSLRYCHKTSFTVPPVCSSKKPRHRWASSFPPTEVSFCNLNLCVTHIWLVSFWKSTVA